MRRIFWTIFFIGLIVLAGFVWWKYYFVFGEGVKSGELNYAVKKGDVFKTYEGKLIQAGFRANAPGTMASYEFEFSVTDERVAQQLAKNSGKFFDLHYKEYHGYLPWRGMSRYIVDSIISMKEIQPDVKAPF
jgi:hypothetical protein